MSGATLILAAVTLQRAGELGLARYNTARLLERGAIEVAAEHYPILVATHLAWLAALWLLGRNQSIDIIGMTGYGALQCLRMWVILTLGARWTTRIIVLPGEPLICSGPYRFLSHPNYVVVAGEIALLPLALHLPMVALIFSALNALVLAVRVRAENRALALASQTAP